jgi:hypothetical protein
MATNGPRTTIDDVVRVYLPLHATAHYTHIALHWSRPHPPSIDVDERRILRGRDRSQLDRRPAVCKSSAFPCRHSATTIVGRRDLIETTSDEPLVVRSIRSCTHAPAAAGRLAARNFIIDDLLAP